jgi:hypothetical protein
MRQVSFAEKYVESENVSLTLMLLSLQRTLKYQGVLEHFESN